MYHKKEKVMYTNKGRYPKKDVEQIEKSISDELVLGYMMDRMVFP